MRHIPKICAFILPIFLFNPSFASNDVPSSLGEMRLGAISPETMLVPQTEADRSTGEAREVRYLKPNAAKLMWASLLPGLGSSGVTGSVTLYKGKLVSVELSSASLKFSRVRAAIIQLYGKGWGGKNFISEVEEGCEPYMFDQWITNERGIFLIGDKKARGVSVYLRDNDLNYSMSTDDTVHIEYEQCIEF